MAIDRYTTVGPPGAYSEAGTVPLPQGNLQQLNMLFNPSIYLTFLA